ncbi:MAG: glycosyltransferase [Gammaproteobacteria bacterium]|nr:glycosyltransferase [Gammaproteobacteria bacterium]
MRNEAGSIRSFVNSLLEQSRKPDEIMIVDGASTDGTREILEEYAARGLLRVISQPCNIAEGRNLGIAAATGTHLAVTDAGCQVDPDWLKQIVYSFNSDPAPDVVAGNFLFETHTRFEEAVIRATFSNIHGETVTDRRFPSSRSVAFTKKAWERVGGYPEWLYAAEDTLFTIRLRQSGCRFAFAQKAFVRWRPRESWRALARQRINFSRGNARIGFRTKGFLSNLGTHALILLLLLVSPIWPIVATAALTLFIHHVYSKLWPQTKRSTLNDGWGMRLYVLCIMEFVRLANLYGYILGRWDRLTNAAYISNLKRYINATSVDDLPAEYI